MARETNLGVHNLILPLFVQEGEGKFTPIASMPGQARLSIDLMVKHCQTVAEAGYPVSLCFRRFLTIRKTPTAPVLPILTT